MLKTTVFTFAIYIAHFMSLPAQNMQWAKQMGGIDNDWGKAMAIDDSGNMYTIGYFKNTSDFDPGTGTFYMTSAGDFDIFISKMDGFGNFVWAVQLGGAYSDHGFSIAVDAAGNVYTSGFFYGNADFDPGPGTFNLTSVGGEDVFISKLNSQGKFIWARQIGGISDEKTYSMVIDDPGNIYVSGSFIETADFDPGPVTFNLTSEGYLDAFLCKLDTHGNFIWARQLGGADFDKIFALTISDSGYLYITGQFGGTVDFDSGPGTFNLTSIFSRDIFIAKLHNSGSFVWAKQFGGQSNAAAYSIATDKLGNVYTTGQFNGTIDMDPGAGIFNISATGYEDVFISKLNPLGNFEWVKVYEGTNSASGYSVAIDDIGNIYTTGYFLGTADFDPGPGQFNLTSSVFDVFISKSDASGNFVWAVQLEGTSFAVAYSIIVDDSYNVYSMGVFADTADFNPGSGAFTLTSAGATDIFIHKMSQNNISSVTERNFGTPPLVYPNPTTGMVSVVLSNELKLPVISLTDIHGKKVSARIDLNGNNIKVDLRNLPQGFYFLQLIGSDEAFRMKLIKE